MGNGFVYWLMLCNTATSAGWMFLTIHNFKLKRINFAFSCLIFTLYLLIVAYIHYDAYVFHKTSYVCTTGVLRFGTSTLGLISTFIFVKDADMYELKI